MMGSIVEDGRATVQRCQSMWLSAMEPEYSTMTHARCEVGVFGIVLTIL